jgi:hypothetical protein
MVIFLVESPAANEENPYPPIVANAVAAVACCIKSLRFMLILFE